jgi:hypothetical protein
MPIPADELDELLTLMHVRQDLRAILSAAVPEQLTPLPPLPEDDRTLHACEELIAAFGRGETLAHLPDGALKVPRWIFVEHAVRRYGFLAHGSANPDITVFEPHAAQDNLVGGEQPRVYAASSGVLAGFYAIVDRARLDELPVIPALINLYVPPQDGGIDRFLFALDWRALPYAPWRRGTLYLLPRETFTADHGGEQWYSAEPVVPRIALSFGPEDWPLLDQVRGADVLSFLRRGVTSLRGWPWWPDPSIYPATLAQGKANIEGRGSGERYGRLLD